MLAYFRKKHDIKASSISYKCPKLGYYSIYFSKANIKLPLFPPPVLQLPDLFRWSISHILNRMFSMWHKEQVFWSVRNILNQRRGVGKQTQKSQNKHPPLFPSQKAFLSALTIFPWYLWNLHTGVNIFFQYSARGNVFNSKLKEN